MQDSFSPAELHTTVLIAPRGNIILSPGDPTSVTTDLPSIIEIDVVPEVLTYVAAAKGVRIVAENGKKMTEWRNFFQLHAQTRIHDQPKLITHSGHGSDTLL